MKLRVFACAILLLAAGLARAADPIYTSWLSSNPVGGYDAVSFFSGEPQKGSKDFALEYSGKTWLFANADNLAKFKAEPEKYAPQYGGYCAWAAAQNKLAPGDPKYWRIVDGKLYLNYSKGVQKDWEVDIPGFIKKANENWHSLVKQ